MAKAAKEHLQQETLTVTADAGYSNGKQFLVCEDAGITAYVPPNRTVNAYAQEAQRFERKDFVYDAQYDHYPCPQANG